MKNSCTGVILSGGMNTRFSGANKAFLSIGEKHFLDYLYEIFQELFEETILITNNPLEYLGWDKCIVTDIFPVRSSLTGIHTGLFYATNPFVFFTACDTPFLKKELVQLLIDHIEPRTDVVIPETASGIEPLCAVYSKQCLKPVEQHIRQEKFKIRNLLRKFRVRTISEPMLREKDPELVSFFNINTPEYLAKAREIVRSNEE